VGSNPTPSAKTKKRTLAHEVVQDKRDVSFCRRRGG